MIYLSIRRLLLPIFLCLAIFIVYRSSHRSPTSYLSSLVVDQPIVTIPQNRVPTNQLTTPIIVQDPDTGKHIEPPISLYYEHGESLDLDAEEDPTKYNESAQGPHYLDPLKNSYLRTLLQCPNKPNKHNGHIRIPFYVRPISMVLYGDSDNEKRSYLNAAILSLPYWSENQYLLVSRVQTDGTMQLNMICEANICYTNASEARPGEKPCNEDDLYLLGGAEGMRCATPPVTLDVPPTPAKSCGEGTGVLMDVPGFHDPRIFWTGKGEPLMILNSQSRYACFGLWAIDLRRLHYPLDPLLSSNPKFPSFGPLMSYPHLTEITRNPPSSRGTIEKNWMFFSTASSTYVHYDIGPSVRSFAKLLGGGLSTPNLTDPLEQPCLREGALVNKNEDLGGSWHQATNSLRLILCERSDGSCRSKPENTVFWSLIHHKHKNVYHLPLRYERYFVIWSSTPPFNMLAISSHPLLLANETAGGWTPAENWEDDAENAAMIENYGFGKDNFAVFTYTVSIAYSWGRPDDQPQDKYTGFLDDEVIIGLGVDDEAQNYARVKVSELLQCMRVCPPRASEPLDGSGDPEFVARKKMEEEEREKNGGKQAFSEDRFGGAEDRKIDEETGETVKDEKEKDAKTEEKKADKSEATETKGKAEKAKPAAEEVAEEAREHEALFSEKQKLAKAKDKDAGDTTEGVRVATTEADTKTKATGGIPASPEKALEIKKGEDDGVKEDMLDQDRASKVDVDVKAQAKNVEKTKGEQEKEKGQAKDKMQPVTETGKVKDEVDGKQKEKEQAKNNAEDKSDDAKQTAHDAKKDDDTKKKEDDTKKKEEDDTKNKNDEPKRKEQPGKKKDKSIPTKEEIKAATGNMPKPEMYLDDY